MSSIKTAHDEESSPKLDSSKRDSKDGPDRVYSLPVLNESEESDLAYAAALLSSGEDKEASDPKWITTRTELWSFYSYYVGNCGVSEMPAVQHATREKFQTLLTISLLSS